MTANAHSTSNGAPLTRPLHVCVLTSVHPPMDTRIFHREAKAARDGGAKVTLIAPGAPKGEVDGIRFKSLPDRGGRAARPLRWPVLFVKAWRTNADIYHFHDPELLPWGLLLKWVTGKPVVYDSHEYLKEDITTKHWIPAPVRKPLAWLADRVEKGVAKRLSAVVAVTEDMSDRFRRVQPLVATVRNLPPVSEVPDPPGGKQPIVMYAGLLSWDRGLDILWDTARLVHQRRPDARFEIYGTVEWHGIAPEIAAKTPEEWAAIGVDFKGSVPFDEVGPAIARGQIGWLPRSPHEPNNLLAWPNKLVEYMAAGLAIVASDLPTQAAVIAESDTGIAVEALSPGAHADAIAGLLDDPAELTRLSSNGKTAAREKYSWDAESLKLQQLYRKVGGELP